MFSSQKIDFQVKENGNYSFIANVDLAACFTVLCTGIFYYNSDIPFFGRVSLLTLLESLGSMLNKPTKPKSTPSQVLHFLFIHVHTN